MGVEYQQSGLIKNFYLLTEKFAVYLLSVAILYRIPHIHIGACILHFMDREGLTQRGE